MQRRRPEQYQLAFDYGRKTESEASAYQIIPGYFAGLDSRQGTPGRFVRAVKEEISIRSPSDAGRYLLERVFTPFEALEQEELWVLMLNTKNLLTHESMVYRGLIDTVPIRLAEVFREAVRVNARGILLSHCHPSGDPTPSPQDVRMTHEAHLAGILLDINLIDHIIVGQDRWVSLKERGLGFDTQ